MKKVQSKTQTPFWRDNRVIPYILQLLFLILVFAVGFYFLNNAIKGLEKIGISLGFGFLEETASFTIGETMIDYQPSDSYGKAILVGIVNTVKVSFVGVIFATILGVFVGFARLSNNWLVSKTASVYIEVLRNTPLLVQIFILYFAVFINLPTVKNSIDLPGQIHLSNKGAAMPWFEATSATGIWLILFFVGILCSAFLWKSRIQKEAESGERKYPLFWALGGFILSLVLAGIVTQQPPAYMTYPTLGKFNFTGGYTVTPEFAAITLGLILYTATYIAEIVRGGILSVSKGQVEAARALGLKSRTTMRLVIFPQAIRVIIPPLTSQFLNLAKNSSLAIAVGYPDLVSVGNTIFNQTGKVVEMVSVMILVYLTMSLITSFFMNVFNKKTQLVER
jgi:general L-amino acid transport system permease protein